MMRHLELRPLVFSVWEVFGVGAGLRFHYPRSTFSSIYEGQPIRRRTETTGFSERMKHSFYISAEPEAAALHTKAF